MDISPVNNQRALNVTNAVSVLSPGTIKSTSGSITTVNTTTAGPGAINIVGETAALRTPIDITLDSVNATNTASAPFVINVNNTTDGGFKILGSGTTAGSGGTITLAQQGAVMLNTQNITLKNMNFTNANTLDGGLTCTTTNVTTCRGAINLNNAATVALDNVFIDRTVVTGGVEYGLFGNTVSNLTINNSTIQNQGDATTVNSTEGAMRFQNLTGTSSFTNSTFRVSAVKSMDAMNNTGTLNLTITGSTFSENQVGTGADLVFFRAQTTANVTMNVVNSTFTKMRTAGLAFISQNTAVANVNVTGSSFDPVAPTAGRAIDLSSNNTAALNFNINNNPKIYAIGGIAINLFAISSSVMQGRINNNPDIKLGGPVTAGSGIVGQVNDNATSTLEVIGNTISGIGNDRGIRMVSEIGSTSPAGRLDATITGNSVSIDPSSIAGIDVQAGTGAADISQLCANVRTNSVTGAGGPVSFKERTGSVGATVFLEGFLVNATTT